MGVRAMAICSAELASADLLSFIELRIGTKRMFAARNMAEATLVQVYMRIVAVIELGFEIFSVSFDTMR